MRTSEAFPSKYLRAADLNGAEPTVTIDRVEAETLNDKLALVVYFKGKEAGLVLNKTNARSIEALTGSDETDDWPGTRLKLIVMKVEFQGKRVPAIRIDAPEKAPKTASKRPVKPAPPVLDDDDEDLPVDEAPDDDSIPF
jgi:hypothetical protein